jgi:hypothetical protein
MARPHIMVGADGKAKPLTSWSGSKKKKREEKEGARISLPPAKKHPQMP